MKRAIKFKLKNGRVVTIRPWRADDYDAVMRYMKEFRKGPSAKWTWQYPERPLPPREQAVKDWTNENGLFVAAFDGDQVIGTANITKKMPDHPWSGRVAVTGTTILEKYTSMGLGTKFKQIVGKWATENNVHKLESSIRHKNTRSLGNLLKQGYEIVGILHDTAFIDGEWHHGIANLGIRPTIDEAQKVVRLETHLIGWQGNLYGRRMQVELLRFLRPEKRFGSVEELRAQIAADVQML